MSAVRQLPTRLVEKVWGRDTLPAPFVAPAGKRIGEIWFEPPAEFPQLLVKYLFTSEKLSVQVHPSNSNALAGEAGKEECWLVLDAQEGAQLAIGFDREFSPQEVEAAALDGSIEQMLTWHSVAPGDVYFLPPGTVHAIGPGLSLVEVQQNSDTTFRLYHYGRPRELHLERAMAVAHTVPYDAGHMSSVAERGEALIRSDHFRLDRVVGKPSDAIIAEYQTSLLALPLKGEVRGSGGDGKASAGECLYAESINALDFEAAELTLLTCPA